MISRVQVTLTPNEAKRVIARGIAVLPEIVQARARGKILFKGGTTVSAVAEELAGVALRISGRISARGSLIAVSADPASPHSLLLEDGRGRNVDADLPRVAKSLGPGDVVVIGANAVDAQGNAAIMAGAEGGGVPGDAMAALMSEGACVIIAAGLEKLIPGTIREAAAAAGRKSFAMSIGMAVGLIPVAGRLVTERDALGLLARVRATVIGKGGILGGEGSTVLSVEGEPEETEKIFALVLRLKGSPVSGSPDSLPECTGPNPRCATHLGCVYKAGYQSGKGVESSKSARLP